MLREPRRCCNAVTKTGFQIRCSDAIRVVGRWTEGDREVAEYCIEECLHTLACCAKVARQNLLLLLQLYPIPQ